MTDVKPVLPLRRSTRRASVPSRNYAESSSPCPVDEKPPKNKRDRKLAKELPATVKIEPTSDETAEHCLAPPTKRSKKGKRNSTLQHVKEERGEGVIESPINVSAFVQSLASTSGQTPKAQPGERGGIAPGNKESLQQNPSSSSRPAPTPFPDRHIHSYAYQPCSYTTEPHSWDPLPSTSAHHAHQDALRYDDGLQLGSSTQLVSVKDTKIAMKAKGKEPNTPAKRKTSANVEEGEKRPARFRERCPQNTRDRANRVKSQRMYMVHREAVPGVPNTETFKVLGSTGNVYSIVIGANPTCNCPDCMKGNVPCKHIIFVFLKVLKVPEHSGFWYQKGLLTTELEQIFAASPKAMAGASAPEHLRKAYLHATGGAIDGEEDEKQAAASGSHPNRKLDSLGEDCPVCYEEMSENDDKKGRLVYDEVQGGCGKPLHTDCFKMWAQTATKKGDAVTCVWCRTPWPDAAGGSSGRGKGPQYTATGYLNMAAEAGMSRQRDTSTYYYGPRAGERLWTAQYRYMDDY